MSFQTFIGEIHLLVSEKTDLNIEQNVYQMFAATWDSSSHTTNPSRPDNFILLFVVYEVQRNNVKTFESICHSKHSDVFWSLRVNVSFLSEGLK